MSDARPFLDRVRQSRMRRYWTRRLEAGPVSETLRKDARKLRRILDQIERSSVALQGDQADPKLGLPQSTLWAERPIPWWAPITPTGPTSLDSGTKLSPDTTLYHDGKASEIFSRQTTSDQGAHYALSLDITAFDGDYVSLAIGLPQEQIDDINRSDLIRLDIAYSAERPVIATARANIKIGPNVEVITRDIDRARAKPSVEFDLFYVDLDTQKITDVWIDVIFQKPDINLITVHDLRLSRRPRAKT